MLARLRIVGRVLGWAGLVFFAFLIADEALEAIVPNSKLYGFISVCTDASGAWLAVRLCRLAIRRGIWRLRNRLLAAYLAVLDSQLGQSRFPPQPTNECDRAARTQASSS